MAPSRAPVSSGTAPESNPDPDPIIASYSVFIKPPLPPSRKLLILQQPNKAAASVPYGDSVLPLTELRLKPHSGIVEADIRIDTTEQYDRTKGMAWGAALQKSTAARSGGSHGLPGGFGSIRPVRGRGGPGGGQGEGDEGMEEVLDWGDAVRQDRVLRMRTLGGQAPELTDCTVMIGVFQGDALHLTPATNHIQLRTQLHHLDAVTEQERQTRQSTGPGATAAAGQDGKPASSARAIQMTVKAASGAEGDTLTTETMSDRLRRVQREPWVRMPYADENSDESWEMYAESLLVRPAEERASAGVGARVNSSNEMGKGKAAETEASDLKDKVPQLEARWDDDEFLQAVSGMKGRIGAVKVEEDDEMVEVKRDPESAKERGKDKGKAKEVAAKVENDPPTQRARRPNAMARGGTRVSNARAAKGGQASTPMEID